MARLDGDRDVRKLAAVVQFVPEPVVEDDDEFDPLVDAKVNLALVKAALLEAVPREVAALSKRRQELVALVQELSGKKEVSLVDQLRDIRARRTGS